MSHPIFPAASLDAAGLNLHAVFTIAELPAGCLGLIPEAAGYRQLILFGHAGRRLWECVQASGIGGEHPIDHYSIRTVEQWFAEHLPSQRYCFLYPGDAPIGLQALGTLAGWHHPSPFRIGVNADWGSWFAYRAAVLADTDFAPSPPVDRGNPCLSCRDQPCLAACPAGARADGQIAIEDCVTVRLRTGSPCALQCLARNACPVGREHRYDDAQTEHSMRLSLRMIREHYGKGG